MTDNAFQEAQRSAQHRLRLANKVIERLESPIPVPDLPPFILQKFAKDTGLPLTIFEQPYFGNQLALVQQIFPYVEELWLLFLGALEKHGSPDAMLEAQHAVKEKLLEIIQQTLGYQRFVADDFSALSMIAKKGLSPYVRENNGRRFLSFDMRHANFQTLRAYDPKIFLEKEWWEHYVALFTDTEYFERLRMLRQVVFGKLNTKKIVQYQRRLAFELQRAVQQVDFGDVELWSLGHDEILLWGDQESLPVDDALETRIDTIRSYMERAFNIHLHVTLFDLEALQTSTGAIFFVRRHQHHNPHRVDFRGLNKHLFAQAARYVLGEEPRELDRYFRYEGQLAMFAEPLRFEKSGF
jgi:hypothetical protein